MEQNLSESERNQRLIAGVVLELLAVAVHLTGSSRYVAVVLALAGLGLFVNYVTCFCGVKKLVRSLV